MEKIVLTAENVENITLMHESTDEANILMANEILRNCDAEKSKHAFILIYAVSNKANSYFKREAPSIIEAVHNASFSSEYPIPFSSILHYLMTVKAEVSLVDMCFKLYDKKFRKSLESFGYPVKNLKSKLIIDDKK